MYPQPRPIGKFPWVYWYCWGVIPINLAHMTLLDHFSISLSMFGHHITPTAPATGNVKMKRVCFRTKRVCFSSANVGVVFSLSLETRRKSLLVPCSVYSWIIHGILKAFPFVIFCTLCLRRKRYSSMSVTRP